MAAKAPTGPSQAPNNGSFGVFASKESMPPSLQYWLDLKPEDEPWTTVNLPPYVPPQDGSDQLPEESPDVWWRVVVPRPKIVFDVDHKGECQRTYSVE